jgi:hypothetical protein
MNSLCVTNQELAGLMSQIATSSVTRKVIPADFMFRLSAQEAAASRSQSVTLKAGRGRHRKYLPYAFTEQGVAMLSSVLRGERAIHVNIEIMRAFVRLRQMLASNAELARKLAALERKYESQVKIEFDAISELMMPQEPKKKGPIDFGSWDDP